jgi:hypothetical protein
MKTQKAPLSIRIFYWIINFNLILLMLFALGTIANILFKTHFFWNDMELFGSFGLPFKVDFLETGNLKMDNQLIKLELVQATGRIKILDSPNFISKYIAPFRLLLILAVGYLFWIFRKFLKNVKDGKTFEIKNISLLKQLAFGLALLWFYNYMAMAIAYHLIAKHIEFENIIITDDFDGSPMLTVALMIWVLAHIFIKGVKLQEEKDLTI